jgi:excisionase family DNA binding protein
MTVGDKWIPVSVVAKRLNVSSRTVYRLIDEKHLECRRVGVKGCTQVSEVSVIRFVDQRVEGE